MAKTSSQKSDFNERRVGLYGGTFDPIHHAHLIVAEFIREEWHLDKVIFIPAGIPPHKQVYSPKELRLQMVQVSIDDNPHFECSDIEVTNPAISYSVDTIAAMKEKLGLSPDALFWILGSDNFVSFHKWKAPERILELCQLVVFPRHYEDFERAPEEFRAHPRVHLMDAPVLEIASTQIRSFVKQSRSIRYLVPREVEGIIREHKLYA